MKYSNIQGKLWENENVYHCNISNEEEVRKLRRKENEENSIMTKDLKKFNKLSREIGEKTNPQVFRTLIAKHLIYKIIIHPTKSKIETHIDIVILLLFFSETSHFIISMI